MKLELVLPDEWVHLEKITCQVSLGEQNIHQSSCGIDTWAVVKAWQLHNVGVELLHMMHKLTHADALGLLEHFCHVVPFLFSHVAAKHGEKIEHHAVIK